MTENNLDFNETEQIIILNSRHALGSGSSKSSRTMNWRQRIFLTWLAS